jgi:hypothetical protein
MNAYDLFLLRKAGSIVFNMIIKMDFYDIYKRLERWRRRKKNGDASP